MRLPLLTAAVVGHTNTGKTSLLRTLTRDVGFGQVSDRPPRDLLPARWAAPTRLPWFWTPSRRPA